MIHEGNNSSHQNLYTEMHRQIQEIQDVWLPAHSKGIDHMCPIALYLYESGISVIVPDSFPA